MSSRRDAAVPPPSEAEREWAFRRLLQAIGIRWNPAASFASKVATGLSAALELLAADPQLAAILIRQDRHPDRISHLHRARLGELLLDAAELTPGLIRHPFMVEPLLIDGVDFRITRHYERHGAASLPELLPGLAEYLLAYYLDPHVAHRFALELASG